MLSPNPSPSGQFLEATADVAVRVRGAAVDHAEQAAVQVLVIVPTTAQTRVGRAEAPAIRDVSAVASCVSAGIDPLDTVFLDYLKSRNPASGRLSDKRSARTVTEVGWVFDDIHAIAVIIAPIHPIIYIIPQSFDPTVLNANTVGRPIALLSTRMIGHTIGCAHILSATVVTAAVTDLRLGVPIGKLDQIQHLNSQTHSIVKLPNGCTQIVNTRPSRRSGNAGFGLATGL